MMKSRLKRIDNFIHHPVEVQKELFRDHLLKGRNTVFGEDHQFSKISNLKQFQEQIPIRDYEDIEPYINRIMKGEKDILWPGKISWFAKSSGTTNDKSKFIPVTSEALADCHYRAAQDLMVTLTMETFQQ